MYPEMTDEEADFPVEWPHQINNVAERLAWFRGCHACYNQDEKKAPYKALIYRQRYYAGFYMTLYESIREDEWYYEAHFNDGEAR